MKKIGIIIGATREGRIGRQIAEQVLKQSSNSEQVSYDLIDLKEVNLPLLDEPYPASMGKYQHPHTLAWSSLIKSYAGFIIVTPEYNHGYPAALKNALDYLYAEWNNKPVAFVGYGYSASGSRSVMQLNQVANAVQLKVIGKEVLINLAVNAKDGVFFSNDGVDGQFKLLCTILEKELL